MTFNIENPQPGIYDITNEEYHSSPGLSRSAIMELKKSPLHYWDKYLNPKREKQKPTLPMIFGNALHTYVLEKEKLGERYIAVPKLDARTKAGKEFLSSIEKERGNRESISYEMLNELELISQSIFGNSTAKLLIENAMYEKSIYWNDPETGILCKCRPDILHELIVCDLKTAADASLNVFQRSINSYGYHIQMAMIKDAVRIVLNIELHDFIFIPVEKTRPYAVGVYPLDEASVAQGQIEYKRELIKYAECLEKNEWPGYTVSEIGLPSYALMSN